MLSRADKDRLIRHLEASLQSSRDTEEIARRLPPALGEELRGRLDARTDIATLIEVCAARPGGLISLADALESSPDIAADPDLQARLRQQPSPMPGSFTRTYSGAPWEKRVGYCRALRAGSMIFVTGTAPVADDGSVFAPGDPYRQTARCLHIIAQALADLGASMTHVVRTRLLVTDIQQWEDIGRAHREVFADHPPTTTMVQVAALIDPAMLVEIEADAVVD